MRRRHRTPPGFVEPPGRLLAFDPADWLPLVDVTEYDPDQHRNRMNHVPVGPVRLSFEDWRRQQAWNLFSRARLAWHQAHGWPGGLDSVELLQQTVALRLAEFHGSKSQRPSK